jgi:hypothetical protein
VIQVHVGQIYWLKKKTSLSLETVFIKFLTMSNVLIV